MSQEVPARSHHPREVPELLLFDCLELRMQRSRSRVLSHPFKPTAEHDRDDVVYYDWYLIQ